jgi:hypothetical protein
MIEAKTIATETVKKPKVTASVTKSDDVATPIPVEEKVERKIIGEFKPKTVGDLFNENL